MKLTEIATYYNGMKRSTKSKVKPKNAPKIKYNFEKIYTNLPKEFRAAIKDVDAAAKQYLPEYKKNGGKMKDDIAPAFCEYYFDVNTGEKTETEDFITSLVDRFHLNYTSEAEEDDEDDEYGHQEDYDSDDDFHEFQSAVEDAFEKVENYFKKETKIK